MPMTPTCDLDLHPSCALFLATATDNLPRPVRVRAKRTSRWWHLLPAWCRTGSHTTLGWTLWIAQGHEDELAAPGLGIPLLAHEVTHWQQRARMGRIAFFLTYTFPASWAIVWGLLAVVTAVLGAWWFIPAMNVAAVVLCLLPVWRPRRVEMEAEAIAGEVLATRDVFKYLGVPDGRAEVALEKLVGDRARSMAEGGYWLPADAHSRYVYRDCIDQAIAAATGSRIAWRIHLDTVAAMKRGHTCVQS